MAAFTKITPRNWKAEQPQRSSREETKGQDEIPCESAISRQLPHHLLNIRGVRIVRGGRRPSAVVRLATPSADDNRTYSGQTSNTSFLLRVSCVCRLLFSFRPRSDQEARTGNTAVTTTFVVIEEHFMLPREEGQQKQLDHLSPVF